MKVVVNFIHSVVTKFYQHVLALVFAVREINENPKILPNVTLGFFISDSYHDVQMTYHTTLELLFKSHGVVTANYRCNSRKKLMAIIGALGLDISFHIANTLGLYKIPQVGCTCWVKGAFHKWLGWFCCKKRGRIMTGRESKGFSLKNKPNLIMASFDTEAEQSSMASQAAGATEFVELQSRKRLRFQHFLLQPSKMRGLGELWSVTWVRCPEIHSDFFLTYVGYPNVTGIAILTLSNLGKRYT